MGKVIRLSDYMYRWKEIYSGDFKDSTLQIYMNDGTGEIEIVQSDDSGKVIRTSLTTVDAVCFSTAIQNGHSKIGGSP